MGITGILRTGVEAWTLRWVEGGVFVLGRQRGEAGSGLDSQDTTVAVVVVMKTCNECLERW